MLKFHSALTTRAVTTATETSMKPTKKTTRPATGKTSESTFITPAAPVIPDGFDLEQSVPYLLNRAGVGIGVAFTTYLRQFDITLPGYRVLASLAHKDQQAIVELAEHTSIDVSTLSRLVTSLEDKGLVMRRRDDADARSVKIHLRPQGAQLASQTIPLGVLFERVVTAGFSAEEVKVLKQMLRRMYTNLAPLGE
ncbi:transcriptional regulator MarR family (plasmid) [Cupriavidus necator N-1]|uniref:Transcriptional regulator MarR family n=1 Tax=Cupriavidus necator (strain ATCC 43291 / DSM 13513 / CCUG 52238 / LMG 8453 / N-1) TaxID=1042878 RepID=F8GVR3_CUPNN|nr:MarR family transcriptional regulator [Cupriavidus necator]AEI82683.1 transcriptional regulator MarR family [Cupriavidus necator N-1]MDX6007677.1 MarR family transcriptional regulator [Cupriavidus necator]